MRLGYAINSESSNILILLLQVAVSPSLFSSLNESYVFKLRVENVFGATSETTVRVCNDCSVMLVLLTFSHIQVSVSDLIIPNVRIMGPSTINVTADQELFIQSVAQIDAACNVSRQMSYQWGFTNSSSTFPLDSRSRLVPSYIIIATSHSLSSCFAGIVPACLFPVCL
jgi:hypothetical protein